MTSIQMNRRRFLQSAAAASALPFLPPALKASGGRSGESAAMKQLRPLGVQLYTVRRLMEEDFEGTLGEVAEVGYQEVEFAGYFGRTAAQVRTLLDGLGLKAPATHLPLQRVRDHLEEEIEFAKTVGHRYLVVPWLGQENRGSLEGYRQVIEILNKGAERCRREGLRLAYHNHDFEFQPLEGQVPMDLMLEESDPALLDIELDLYWITKAGRDPLEYFSRYPGRFKLFHVKDMAGTPEKGFASVGEGIIDWARIFRQIPQAGTEHYFVEQDQPGDDPIGSIRTSFEYLESLEY